MKSIEKYRTLDDVDAYVRAFDRTIIATDPRLRNAVTIIHEEGTILHFEWAFAIKLKDWYVVFTEHHRYYIYHEDDVDVIMRGKRLEIPEQEIPDE
jgi:hypothetical protein